jgi:hypothetical protein
VGRHEGELAKYHLIFKAEHRTRLPTKIQSTHSLPQLPKNPRERLHSMAQLSVTKSKHLPPPNVGNVMGHNYKGVKLTNII